jgi:hypothetical protein
LFARSFSAFAGISRTRRSQKRITLARRTGYHGEIREIAGNFKERRFEIADQLKRRLQTAAP